MLHQMEFAVQPLLDAVGRYGLGIEVILEEIELASIANDVFIVVKGLVPKEREEFLARRITATVVVADINDQALRVPFVDFYKRLLKEVREAQLAPWVGVVVPVANGEHGNLAIVQEFDLGIRSRLGGSRLKQFVLFGHFHAGQHYALSFSSTAPIDHTKGAFDAQ